MVRASKDSSTVTGAHLRWLGSHARGDPQKATSTPREDSTRVFRKPASFLCAYVYLEGGARQVRGGEAAHPRRGPAHRRQHREAARAAAVAPILTVHSTRENPFATAPPSCYTSVGSSERHPAPAVTNDPRPRANISVEPKSGLDPLIQNLLVIGRFRAPCEEGHHMANPIRKPRTRAHFGSQIAAEWPVEAPVLDGADAYLTGFLRATESTGLRHARSCCRQL